MNKNFKKLLRAGLVLLPLILAPTKNSFAAEKAQQDDTQNTVPGLPTYGHCVDVMGPQNCGRSQSGKGYTICEKYLAYLNSLSKPFRCELPVPPDFKHPNWEEVDVMQHLDWAYQAETMRFKNMSWYVKPEYADWEKEFLAEKTAGKIIPAMRKTKIQPLGEGQEVTILGYTRHNEGCKALELNRPYIEHWVGVGYAHFILPETADSPALALLNRFEGVEENEILLYRDQPYFVHIISAEPPPAVILYVLAPWKLDDEPGYRFNRYCHFDPIESN